MFFAILPKLPGFREFVFFPAARRIACFTAFFPAQLRFVQLQKIKIP